MLENKFINYIYLGANDKLTNKPIWQEIGKDNKPIESYMISTIDNSPKIINKPDILKVKDTPEYWGAYYKGIEMLYDPRVTTIGVGGVSVVNDIFNNSLPPETIYGKLWYMYYNRDTFVKNIETILDKKYDK